MQRLLEFAAQVRVRVVQAQTTDAHLKLQSVLSMDTASAQTICKEASSVALDLVMVLLQELLKVVSVEPVKAPAVLAQMKVAHRRPQFVLNMAIVSVLITRKEGLSVVQGLAQEKLDLDVGEVDARVEQLGVDP